MIREGVASSNIAAVGYDADARLLEIEFRPNKNGVSVVWQYADVPADVYADFRASASLGHAFAAIKAAYPGRKVATITEVFCR
jgi:hypothetical protein